MPQRLHLLAFVVILAAGSNLACGSASLPPRLSQAERAEVARLETTPPWPELVIGVEVYEFPAYSEVLVEALRSTGLFARVESMDELSDSPPDLVAVVRSPPRGKAVIPLFTFLSVGLIPTIVDETEGHRFDLMVPDQTTASRSTGHSEPDRRLEIEYIQDSRVVIGWLGLALSVSPNWTVKDTRRHPRTIDRLRMLLLRQHEAISALLSE